MVFRQKMLKLMNLLCIFLDTKMERGKLVVIQLNLFLLKKCREMTTVLNICWKFDTYLPHLVNHIKMYISFSFYTVPHTYLISIINIDCSINNYHWYMQSKGIVVCSSETKTEKKNSFCLLFGYKYKIM